MSILVTESLMSRDKSGQATTNKDHQWRQVNGLYDVVVSVTEELLRPYTTMSTVPNVCRVYGPRNPPE